MSWLLFFLMGIVGIEYIGGAIPQLRMFNAVKLPLLISMIMFLVVVSRHGMSEVWKSPAMKAFVIFIALTGFAMLHGLIRSYAFPALRGEIGYFILMVVTYYILRTPKAFFILAGWIVALHAVLVVFNADHLTQPERVGGFRAGYFMGDGNDFAWSLNIALGLAAMLVVTRKNILVRGFALAAGTLLLLGIIGTQSRGAALALSAALLYFWVYVSKRKLLGVLAVMIVGIGIVSFAPAHYFTRMQTITAYEEDTSATGRLTAWGHAIEMAVDHPLLGVGAGSFNSAYGRFYRMDGDPSRWISTHSVYFKVLAEYSFIGLGIFLSIIIFNLRQNRRTARLLSEMGDAAPLPSQTPEFINMAIVAYSVAAAFLSGVDYPHLYLLTAMTWALKWMAERAHAAAPVEMAVKANGEVSTAPEIRQPAA
jgi:probable O-glycosylation ligase (exosortase A-associated)